MTGFAVATAVLFKANIRKYFRHFYELKQI